MSHHIMLHLAIGVTAVIVLMLLVADLLARWATHS
jgi:hypothetical protein